MEMLFDKKPCHCLRQMVDNVQQQEQTEEVRLSESMPDIGRVLGCWGQVLIRGKEWRSGGMGVSGGVMVWTLYAPEDGSDAISVESWIPFQMKWELPDSQRDGTIIAIPYVNSVDARSVSARKLMIRANISIAVKAMEPWEPEVCCPGTIPPDIQLLNKSYPVELPMEAGEMSFQLEEELMLPGDVKDILRVRMTPQILEQKVMAGRLVFRGKALLQLLYMRPEGMVASWEQELPFSQYTELDKDHGANATAWIVPVMTGVEAEKNEENKLLVKASMAAQYVIYDRQMLDLVQDAYSTQRQLELKKQALDLPVRLDQLRQTLALEQGIALEGSKVVDVSCVAEQPVCRHDGQMLQIAVPAQFQVLYLDFDGNLQSVNVKTEALWQMSSDPGNKVFGFCYPQTQPKASFTADMLQLSAEPAVSLQIFSGDGLSMVTDMELGQLQEADDHRPSVILLRCDDSSLWDIAKACGSTVDAICHANQLQGEPESGKMLLIPVL